MISAYKIVTIATVLLPQLVSCAEAQDHHEHQVPWVKPRVVICTDLGASDEDDIQSLIHYLTYADRFETEGMISSPPGAGRVDAILRVLDAYASDWQWLRDHADFPHPSNLKKRVKQGAVVPALPTGHTAATQGSEWIIRCARKQDARPLWILVWGSVTDIAQALHDAPDIEPKIRVHCVGSGNPGHDSHAFGYLRRTHPSLFLIQDDTTFRGWDHGGNQTGDLGNLTFVAQHVANHGALGQRFASCHADGATRDVIRMAGSATVAYLLRGTSEDPTQPHWGGRFIRQPGRPQWFIDHPAPSLAEGDYPGARTVNRWRTYYLRDWQERMDWCLPLEATTFQTLRSRKDEWFRSDQAREIALNVISHQASSGGWAKGRGTFEYRYHGDKNLIRATFDNSASLGELRFLARMARETGDALYAVHCLRGIDFVLAAQDQRTGGWPQDIPAKSDYGRQITFNDDAMINVLHLLRDISRKEHPFDTEALVADSKRQNCAEALQRGIRCILDTQIIQHGRLTVWCAQHDRSTLLPCAARAYEHPSLSGLESVTILRFLMGVSHPDPHTTEAVHNGVAWFRNNVILGTRFWPDPNGDAKLEADPVAPPIWPRFAELGSNRPIFSDYDGIIRYEFDQISQERQNHYRWYSARANSLLADYAGWSQIHPQNSRRLVDFGETERPLRRPRQSRIVDREIAVRNYASVANISYASRTDYLPAANGAGDHPVRVILCPSGDYRHLQLSHAHQQAAQLASEGFPVTVLKYRTPTTLSGSFNPDVRPIDDLTELIRQLRSESSADLEVGVFGTGAGGHLALMAAVHSEKFHPAARPDFVAVGNAPVGTPPDAWMNTLLAANGSDPVLRDFYTATIHAHQQLCRIDFFYGQHCGFRSAAVDMAGALQKRGAQVSITDTNGDQALLASFLQTLRRAP